MPSWDVFQVGQFKQLMQVDEPTVRAMLADGRLTDQDCVRPAGTEEWMRVSSVEAFSNHSHRADKPSAAQAASKPKPRMLNKAKATAAAAATANRAAKANVEEEPAVSDVPSRPKKKAQRPRSEGGEPAKARPAPAKASNPPAREHRSKATRPAPKPGDKVRVTCKACGKGGKLPASKIGTTVDCPGCGKPVKIPKDAEIISGGQAKSGAKAKLDKPKKKRKQYASSNFLEAGSASAFFFGCILSVVGAGIGSFIWFGGYKAIGLNIDWVFAPIVGVFCGAGMLIGYRGHNTLGGYVAGAVSALSVLGFELFIFVVFPQVAVEHMIAEAGTDAGYLKEYKVEQAVRRKGFHDAWDAPARVWEKAEKEVDEELNKMTPEQIAKEAADVRFKVEFDKEQFIFELAQEEHERRAQQAAKNAEAADDNGNNADVEDIRGEGFNPLNNPLVRETREKVEKMDEAEIRAEWESRQLKRLRNELAEAKARAEVGDSEDLDWQAQEQKIQEAKKRHEAEVNQLTASECRKQLIDIAKGGVGEAVGNVASNVTGLGIAVFIMYLGVGGIAALLLSVGAGYMIGSGDMFG